MNSSWKAILAFLVLIILLTGVGTVAGRHIYPSYERILSEASAPLPESRETYQTGMSEKDYKKIRLAFNSFDLAAGLTRNDFESIPALNTHSFATLWLCVGAIFFLQKPRKTKRP